MSAVTKSMWNTNTQIPFVAGPAGLTEKNIQKYLNKLLTDNSIWTRKGDSPGYIVSFEKSTLGKHHILQQF